LMTTAAGLCVCLLVTSTLAAVVAWQHHPRPGVQVEQQCAVYTHRDILAVLTPVRYLLYLPPNYTRRTKLPLVVYLHGSGSRGYDLNLVRREGPTWLVDHAKKFGFILLSPQVPPGGGWKAELLIALIEHVRESVSIDENRMYLTGVSMGGNGTWAIGAYDPGYFAAIAPLCGQGHVWKAKRLAHVPIWAFHGAKDSAIPLKDSQVMVDAVRKCGGDVKFTIYPNAGHGICGMTYENPELCNWFLSHRRMATTHPAGDQRQ